MSEETGPIGRVIMSFWEGISTTTMYSWVGAVGVCFFELALCCVLFTERRLAVIDPLYFMETSQDEYAELSFHLLAYKNSHQTDLQVAYLGASMATRALYNLDEDKLSDYLEERVDQPLDFRIFSTNDQRYPETLLVTQHFPPSFHGIAVLVISANKDHFPAKHNANQQKLIDEIDVAGTGIYFLDHLNFFAARRNVILRMGKAPEFYSGDPMTIPNRVQKARDLIFKRAEAGPFVPVILGRDRQIVETMVNELANRDTVTVFIEAPKNPFWDEAMGPMLERYRNNMTAFVSKLGAYYYDFNPDMNFNPREFEDHMHLGDNAARRRYQSALLDCVADVINKEFPTGREHVRPTQKAVEKPDEADQADEGDGDDQEE